MVRPSCRTLACSVKHGSGGGGGGDGVDRDILIVAGYLARCIPVPHKV